MHTFMHAQYGAAARHSAANAGSATVTAELTRLNTNLLSTKLHRDLEESFLENDGKIVSRCSGERTYVIYGNIMYDRRVVRGNTYAQTVIPTVCRLLRILISSLLRFIIESVYRAVCFTNIVTAFIFYFF